MAHREDVFAAPDGTRFYYELAGAGPALVFLHAGITDGRMWNEQFRAFAREHTVLRYDRRGFGQTEAVSGPFSHRLDLHDMLAHLGIERATLVGCSQGGKIALDFALEQAEMVESLVLVASALGGYKFDGTPPQQLEELEEAERLGDLARVNELELQIWVDGPHRLPAQVDPEFRERVREMNGVALSSTFEQGREQLLEPAAVSRLDEVRVPTLIVVGELDTPHTLAVSAVLAERIGGARRVVIEGVAHLPSMERPAVFNRIVSGFLREQGRGQTGG